MNIYFINLFRKTIYIIFIGLLLSIISSKESLSSEQVFVIQNLEISKKIDGTFSRNQVINYAFKNGYQKLLQQIIKSSDISKVKSLSLNKIKYLIENFKIQDEFLNNEKYEAKFTINFNKYKVVKFLESKNIFYSSPKKISALFFPILVDEEKIFSFQENIFYRNWLKEKNDNELVNYILPLEVLHSFCKKIYRDNLLKQKRLIYVFLKDILLHIVVVIQKWFFSSQKNR